MKAERIVSAYQAKENITLPAMSGKEFKELLIELKEARERANG